MALRPQAAPGLALLLWALCRTAVTVTTPEAVPREHQGHCYQLAQERLAFEDAQAACGRWGGYLAQVPCEETGTWGALRRRRGQMRGSSGGWWVSKGPTKPVVAGAQPHLHGAHHQPPTCTFLSNLGLLQEATGPTCRQRHPFICEFGPVEGGECPSKVARSANSSRPWQKQKSQLDLTSMGRRPQRLMRRHLGDKQKYPETSAIWEALQDVVPRTWQQELLQRLTLPVNNGAWSASELEEEVGFLQAVSEDLLKRRPPASPHWHLLSLLAVHGTSRLLQVILGPCSPNVNIQHEALTGPLMQILHKLEQALQELGGSSDAITMETPLISIYTHRVNSSRLGNMAFSFPGKPWAARVILPEQSALGAVMPQDIPVDVQMVSFLGSPFPLSSGQGVTGAVAELNLLSEGSQISVSNLSTPVQIFLPRVVPTAPAEPAAFLSPGEALLLTVNVTWTGGSLMIHAHLDPVGPLELFLQPSEQLREPIEPNVGLDGYTWLVKEEVLRDLRGTLQFLVVPLNLSASQGPATLHVSTYGIQCISRHLPDAQWREAGCKVGESSSLAEGHCLCTHLSFFGSSFWVAPVQLDVVRTAEYFGQVHKNPVLVMALGVVYALYLVGVAWARWLDTRPLLQVRPALLSDDDPCAQYGYLLQIFLHGQQKAPGGSPCQVCICLQGSSGVSKSRRLPLNASLFLLREPYPLGELQSIWLWQEPHSAPQLPWSVCPEAASAEHAIILPLSEWVIQRWLLCQGAHPQASEKRRGEGGQHTWHSSSREASCLCLAGLSSKWGTRSTSLLPGTHYPSPSLRHIAHITVRDLQQNRRFHFSCQPWLVPAAGAPHSTAKHFLAAPQHQPTAFWPIFRQRTLSGLREEHTVLTVLLTRTGHGRPVTRVQGLSCCFCLLLCSALVSLMFWEVPHESPELLRVGSCFSLSWKDIMISVESALITFPVNLLLVFIFRHAEPRRSHARPGLAMAVPSAPASPTTLDTVHESLRGAVETLSKASKQSQQLLHPDMDLEELLQWLARFIHPDPGEEEEAAGREPKISSVAPSPNALHQTYCNRYLLLKLQHISRLLGELELGVPTAKHPPALQQRVEEMARRLEEAYPAEPPPHAFLLLLHSRRWHLPWWGTWVGWALLVSLSAVATFFALLYGFHYGKESTERWLISTAISMGQALFVLQPLKVISFAIFCALILKKAEDEDEADLDLEDRLCSLQ
ncbi:polycystin-1-like protein 2 [Zootoca vivipara]|uniref:polycystin-1-like protein 2 n=1 Tax=Zootoca vivipara TaxID=8524 RepID=UPI00293BD4B8|nr:polycystin-1-like protein 2 [Zootoca vivipara]